MPPRSTPYDHPGQVPEHLLGKVVLCWWPDCPHRGIPQHVDNPRKAGRVHYLRYHAGKPIPQEDR